MAIYGLIVVALLAVGVGIGFILCDADSTRWRDVATQNAKAAHNNLVVAQANHTAAQNLEQERDNWRALHDQKAIELRELKSLHFDEAETMVSPLPIARTLKRG